MIRTSGRTKIIIIVLTLFQFWSAKHKNYSISIPCIDSMPSYLALLGEEGASKGLPETSRPNPGFRKDEDLDNPISKAISIAQDYISIRGRSSEDGIYTGG